MHHVASCCKQELFKYRKPSTKRKTSDTFYFHINYTSCCISLYNTALNSCPNNIVESCAYTMIFKEWSCTGKTDYTVVWFEQLQSLYFSPRLSDDEPQSIKILKVRNSMHGIVLTPALYIHR